MFRGRTSKHGLNGFWRSNLQKDLQKKKERRQDLPQYIPLLAQRSRGPDWAPFVALSPLTRPALPKKGVHEPHDVDLGGHVPVNHGYGCPLLGLGLLWGRGPGFATLGARLARAEPLNLGSALALHD